MYISPSGHLGGHDARGTGHRHFGTGLVGWGIFSSVVSNVGEARARSGRMMDVHTLWVDRCVKDQRAHETRRWETKIIGSSFLWGLISASKTGKGCGVDEDGWSIEYKKKPLRSRVLGQSPPRGRFEA